MADQFPDVVVLLPGILGSELAKRDRIIWGWSGGVLMRNLLSAGESLREDLWLHDDSGAATSLEDEVRATRLLPDLHLLPGLWKIDGYGAIEQYLLRTLHLAPGANYFPFPYDWRRDNRAAARRLAADSERWLAAWRKRSGNNRAKLILIGHSMGGLIARYFMEILDGWKCTRALITFGTPHAGSMNAVDSLVNGIKKLGLDLTDVARRMESLHQLLPIYKCCDDGDGELKRLTDTSLPGVDKERVIRAAGFHEEIHNAAQRNAQDESYLRSHEIFSIVGYNQPTYHSVRLNAGGVELSHRLRNVEPGGDGTVPRQSAVPAGARLPRAMFASTKHAALQNSTAALTHIGGVITSLYLPMDFRGHRIELPVQVSLDIEDVHMLSERIAIRAKPSRDDAVLHATLRDHATHEVLKDSVMARDVEGWHRLVFQPPHPGTFEIIVGGKKGCVEQASDVFEVIERPVAYV